MVGPMVGPGVDPMVDSMVGSGVDLWWDQELIFGGIWG